MERGIRTLAGSVRQKRIMSVIGAMAVAKKRLGTTAHVTLQLPCACALGAMHYMLMTLIS